MTTGNKYFNVGFGHGVFVGRDSNNFQAFCLGGSARSELLARVAGVRHPHYAWVRLHSKRGEPPAPPPANACGR